MRHGEEEDAIYDCPHVLLQLWSCQKRQRGCPSLRKYLDPSLPIVIPELPFMLHTTSVLLETLPEEKIL